MSAGIAAASPAAVAINASAMPGATAWMLEEWVAVERNPPGISAFAHTVRLW